MHREARVERDAVGAYPDEAELVAPVDLRLQTRDDEPELAQPRQDGEDARVVQREP